MKKLLLFLTISMSLMLYTQKKWTLQEAVDYAISNNLQVLNSQYNQKIQEYSLEVSKKQALPSLSANIGNTISFGEGRDVFGSTQRNDNFSNSSSINADILLFNNGRIRKNIRKSEYELLASNFDLEKIKNDISLQIAQQYLQILLNREIEKINQSSLLNAQKQYDRAKITTQAGSTPRTILAEAEAALSREKQNLKNSEINTQRSIFNLAQTLRISDYKNFDIVEVNVENKISAPLFASSNIVDFAYQNQPQIKAAENRILAAEAQTKISQTSFWPTISAGAGLATSYFNSLVTDITGMNTNGQVIKEASFLEQYKNNFGQQVSLSAQIPIFNKGINKINVEQSKINEEIAKTSLEIQKQDVLQNVQKAQFDAESNYEIYLASLEAAKSAQISLDFAEKSYEAGKSTIYDLNIARNNYANAEGSVSQAKYNYIFSLKLLNFYAGIPISL